jgi:hypothetical protein
MFEKNDAILVRSQALSAIRALSEVLRSADGKCSEAEMSRIKRVIGLSIGEIQISILDPISATYPGLDDLR